MRHKTAGLLLMILFMSFGLTSCKKSTPQQKQTYEITSTVTEIPTNVPTITTEPAIEIISQPDVISMEELEEKSKEYTNELTKGNAQSIYDNFSEDLKKNLSTQYLISAYEETVEPLGNYIGLNSIASGEYEQYYIVDVIAEYQNNGLLFRYTFNHDFLLEGFFINYQTIDKEVELSNFYEEREIQVGKGDYILDGILTLPKEIENPPVVILVHGSGQNDMDETIGAVSNKPFSDLAHGLAEQGIATIRYNKRYYQYMDQMPENMTVKDEVLDDVSYAIEYAIECQEVNSEQIYIAGHSLGGMLAPKIAHDNIAVKGIIVLAGSPRTLEDIIYDQAVILTEQQQDADPTEIEIYLNMVQENIARIKNLNEEELSEPILGFTGYYWKALNDIDTTAIVQALTIPMLFLQGSADFQVFADKDFVLWEELLTDHENAKFIQYEGLNHLFMPTTGIVGVEDYNTKNNISSQVIEDIAAWLKNEIK